jgi:hypothetical protein
VLAKVRLILRFLLSREYDYDFCSVIHSRENQLISLQWNRNPDDNDLTTPLSLSLRV